MQIAEAQDRGVSVLAPAGRIDTTTASTLDSRLTPLLAGAGPRIVIDFSNVEYISSAGLRVLLAATRRVQAKGGGLTLCCMGEAVRHVFYLAGFLPLFVIHDSREAAIGHLAP
jgi:anti-anti-sigma factor